MKRSTGTHMQRALTTRRVFPFVLCTFLCVLCLRLLDRSAFQQVQEKIFRARWYTHPQIDSPRVLAQQILGKTHVAVYDKEAFHEEVHGSILWTLAQFPNVKVSLWRPQWRWEFDKCIQSWFNSRPMDPKRFFQDLEQDTTIRHVFLPTIDFSGRDWKDVSPFLQRIWEGRKEDEKFNIIGMRHWGTYDLTGVAAWWAERDSISFVTLGDHVTFWLERQHRDRAKQKRFSSPQADGLWRMRIRTYVPIFTPDQREMTKDARTSLDMALIQSGQWDEGHRGMKAIFEELERHLEANASIWGYERDSKGVFVPLPDVSRFTIKLLGAGGLGIPAPIKALFKHERHLSYPDFYDRVYEADLTLPAFGTEKYGENRASSTMGVSATGMTPVLVTQELASAYGWFCPTYSVIRPDAVSEIEYIRQVRAGIIPWQSRRSIKADLEKCQEEWTTRNMLLLAELFALPPESIEGG